MRFTKLSDWLHWQETLHPQTIDLSLGRPGEVMQRMGIAARPTYAVFTIAGTNGKGSTAAMLDSILRAAGYRVGIYTSPHLLRYTERIRINGEEVSDAALCDAFEHVDQARGEISLSYFEFGTLAAFDLFVRADLDAVVLEVGMGGRLDAVNLIDADVAIIAPIDVDHAEWLGSDRETIAREKAGIFRHGRPAVSSDPHPPAMLSSEAARIGTPLYQLGEDFTYGVEGTHWWWQGTNRRLEGLPLPALRGASQAQNAAGVLMAVELLAARLPVCQEDVQAGLLAVMLPGRFQVVPGPITSIFDVGHNPHAARELARNLRATATGGRTLAVVGMLADKDAQGVASTLNSSIDEWFVADLGGARSRSAENLLAELTLGGVVNVRAWGSVEQAYRAALAQAQAGDRVVVFGSFHTVAEALTASV
jgi:dihydrofolate synthase/folylpolyglutamate synthase